MELSLTLEISPKLLWLHINYHPWHLTSKSQVVGYNFAITLMIVCIGKFQTRGRMWEHGGIMHATRACIRTCCKAMYISKLSYREHRSKAARVHKLDCKN